MPFCKIVYVTQRGQRGWRWQALAKSESSAKTYELFFECVLAARASGYAPMPELKCS